MRGTPFVNNGTAESFSVLDNGTDQGVPTVASATTITVPLGLDIVKISGTTTITSIAVAGNFANRRIILLLLDAACAVTAANNINLTGAFSSVANGTLSLVCDGTSEWYEVARSHGE